MIENKFDRAEDPADPRRCQSVIQKGPSGGQCPYLAVPGSSYCPMHGGNKGQEVIQKKMIRQYRLSKWQNRMEEFADHESIKSLREEIGILRMMMEEILVQCQSGNELLMWSTKIADLVMKIEKVVTSCNRLEASTGALLDKSGALHLATMMVSVINKYVSDPDIIDAITNEMAVAVLNLNGKDLLE